MTASPSRNRLANACANWHFQIHDMPLVGVMVELRAAGLRSSQTTISALESNQVRILIESRHCWIESRDRVSHRGHAEDPMAVGGPRQARSDPASGYCQEPEATDTAPVMRTRRVAQEEIPDERSGIQHEEFKSVSGLGGVLKSVSERRRVRSVSVQGSLSSRFASVRGSELDERGCG